MPLNPQSVDIFDPLQEGVYFHPPFIVPTGATFAQPGRHGKKSICVNCEWSYPASKTLGYGMDHPVDAFFGSQVGFAFKMTPALTNSPAGRIFSLQYNPIGDPYPRTFGFEYFSVQINPDSTISLVSGRAGGDPPYFTGTAYPVIVPPTPFPIPLNTWVWMEIYFELNVDPSDDGQKNVSLRIIQFHVMGWTSEYRTGILIFKTPFWDGPYWNIAGFFGNNCNVQFADFLASWTHVSTTSRAPWYGDSYFCPKSCDEAP